MTVEPVKKQLKEYITTGQAASLCSVTPDTVLKWIKAGKIPASRTPGGHYRISRTDVEQFITPKPAQIITEITPRRSFQYCWEFYATEGKVNEDCLRCIVYRSRSSRCYEISQMPNDIGHSKLYCTDSCEECEYYKTVVGQKKSILVVTDNEYLKAMIVELTARNGYNIEFADCEYNCSMLMENYRADFIFLDCSMGMGRTRQFAQHIAADPRLPFVRIVLVGERHQFPRECEKEVFATIANPFKSSDLEELINAHGTLLNK